MQSLFSRGKVPLICVPVTAKTKEELEEQLEVVVEKAPDLIEWRADFFEKLDDTELVIEAIYDIKEKTAVPLLFTIRSEKEGGEAISLTEAEKVELISVIAEKTNIDFIDYEVKNDRAHVEKVRDMTKKNDVGLILSFHDFTKTPSENELLKIASLMEFYGADVAKLAVMPQEKDDVYRLLNATKTIDELLDIPVITMSMGKLGVMSRIIGWLYGSRLTFAVGVERSAPGQVPIEKLREAIEAVQQISD